MPSSMYVPLKDCRSNIEKLLNQLPEIFQYNIMSKLALGPALKSAFNLIKGVGGKIIVVASTLPNSGIGKLQRRNETNVANTAKEAAQLLGCQDAFYKNFTIDCNKNQITIDLFLASEDYIDVASLSNLSRFTGGQTHFYPGWSAAKLTDVTKFTKEFSKHLSMDLSMEAVMRARGSSGLRMTRFYGHFFNRSSDLCAFPTFPRDQSYVFEVSIDEQLVRDYAYLQIAVLLSLNTGQRRIRVITMAIPTTDSLAETYASADQLAITNYFTQKAVEKAYTNLEEAREYLNRSVQEILATYKKEIVVSNTAGGAPLRLCANLRMLPLLTHSLTKHMAFRAGLVPSDHRASALNFLESSPLPYLIKNIYAKVYSLHDMPDEAGLPDENGEIVLPERINATSSLLERYGLYLIDNSTELFLWMGGDAVNELTMDVFGTPDILEIPIGKQELPVLDNSEFNSRVRNSLDMKDRFLSRLNLKHELMPQTVTFTPYTAEQMFEIVMQKLKSLDFDPIIQPIAIRFAAKKCSGNTGDLRKVFDILRSSIEVLELDSIKNRHTLNETTAKVTLAHVAKVFSTLHNNFSTKSRISKLNMQQRLVLCSLVHRERSDVFQTQTSLDEAYDYYSKLLNRKDSISPLKRDEFFEICNALETCGVVNIVQGKSSGKTKHIVKFIKANVDKKEFEDEISKLASLKTYL